MLHARVSTRERLIANWCTEWTEGSAVIICIWLHRWTEATTDNDTQIVIESLEDAVNVSVQWSRSLNGKRWTFFEQPIFLDISKSGSRKGPFIITHVTTTNNYIQSVTKYRKQRSVYSIQLHRVRRDLIVCCQQRLPLFMPLWVLQISQESIQ